MEDHVARDLEGEIADEEDPGAEAEHVRGEPDIAVHMKCCEADVHAVQIVHDEADETEQHDADVELADRPVAQA